MRQYVTKTNSNEVFSNLIDHLGHSIKEQQKNKIEQNQSRNDASITRNRHQTTRLDKKSDSEEITSFQKFALNQNTGTNDDKFSPSRKSEPDK